MWVRGELGGFTEKMFSSQNGGGNDIENQVCEQKWHELKHAFLRRQTWIKSYHKISNNTR